MTVHAKDIEGPDTEPADGAGGARRGADGARVAEQRTSRPCTLRALPLVAGAVDSELPLGCGLLTATSWPRCSAPTPPARSTGRCAPTDDGSSTRPRAPSTPAPVCAHRSLPTCPSPRPRPTWKVRSRSWPRWPSHVPRQVRAGALVALLWSSGMRVGEAAGWRGPTSTSRRARSVCASARTAHTASASWTDVQWRGWRAGARCSRPRRWCSACKGAACRRTSSERSG